MLAEDEVKADENEHSPVDMNKYNLPLERIVDEWTAIVQKPSALQEGGMYLTANDNQRELFVDTLQYSILY